MIETFDSHFRINSLATDDVRNYCTDTELLNYSAVNVTFEPVQFDMKMNAVFFSHRRRSMIKTTAIVGRVRWSHNKGFSLDPDGDSPGK